MCPETGEGSEMGPVKEKLTGTPAELREHVLRETDAAEVKFVKLWFNIKRFDTDGAACAEANKQHPPKIPGHQGWTPQTARRQEDIGPSGRPRGNRAFKLKK